MADTIKINVTDVIGTGFCVASGDGQKVYEKIAEAFRANGKVELSFSEVTDLTSAFLNAAIGQLYGKFSEEFIRENLSFKDLAKEDRAIMKKVADRAKSYFKDSEPYRQAVKDVIGGNDA